jgi:ATP-binding cassette, subfamily F, member 3
MLASINLSEKSFGDKVLYSSLKFTIQEGEKIGLIGRNGTGKSTLFNIITGSDSDFQGEVEIKRGAVVIASRQEHHGHKTKDVLKYIQGDLPEFDTLHHILTTYPEQMGTDARMMQKYSDALERFNQLGYFQIEDEIAQAFEAYQLDPAKLNATIEELSGGQKRMVELIKVQRARGHLALIDEPTNHMDYVAKQAFVKWLKSAEEAVVVITHDRDVLNIVDKIVEIRDGKAYTFKGNYQQYLKTNTTQVTSQVSEYEQTQRRIQNLREDVIRFRRLKERSRDPGTIKRFKSQEQRAATELAELSKTEKPSFWIDRESAEDLNPKMTAAYEQYKSRNIRLNAASKNSKSSRLLIEARDVSLGYGDSPLFSGISFSLREGERLRLHGRNGAGKTTLINAIMARVNNQDIPSRLYAGTIASEKELKLGIYEQEIDSKYLKFSLAEAIEQSFLEKDVAVSDQKIKQLLGNYLFTPNDGETPIERLSGGQKARFQLIRMLLADPLVLILDEPTNHLDLPSIEELENALMRYHGAVIYISHDTYFADKLGGELITIGS